MVTSLVSLTEPGLINPLEGSITCVSVCVCHTWGKSIPGFISAKCSCDYDFKNIHDLSGRFFLHLNGTMLEEADLRAREKVLEHYMFNRSWFFLIGKQNCVTSLLNKMCVQKKQTALAADQKGPNERAECFGGTQQRAWPRAPSAGTTNSCWAAVPTVLRTPPPPLQHLLLGSLSGWLLAATT